MQTYVVTENIRRFRAMLENEQSAERRLALEAMLREEKAKLDDLQRQARGAPAGGGGDG